MSASSWLDATDLVKDAVIGVSGSPGRHRHAAAAGGKQMKALITGASSGIGREMAWQLSAMGIEVILVARRLTRLQALREELENTPRSSAGPAR
ncbi:MAG: SDR family NAD(P)-dependent oxidoreductase [Merdibacter sp.]